MIKKTKFQFQSGTTKHRSRFQIAYLTVKIYYEKDPLSKIARVTGKTIDEIKQILEKNGIITGDF